LRRGSYTSLDRRSNAGINFSAFFLPLHCDGRANRVAAIDYNHYARDDLTFKFTITTMIATTSSPAGGHARHHLVSADVGFSALTGRASLIRSFLCSLFFTLSTDAGSANQDEYRLAPPSSAKNELTWTFTRQDPAKDKRATDYMGKRLARQCVRSHGGSEKAQAESTSCKQFIDYVNYGKRTEVKAPAKP
jgi:hypothetical protein